MTKPPVKGWYCDECGSFWAVEHFAHNPYKKFVLEEGARCPADWSTRRCKGVLHEAYANEETDKTAG